MSIGQNIRELAKVSRNKVLHSWRRRTLPDVGFSIISNNCWGGFVSHYFGLPYNSPFAGLFLFAPDYITMLGDLQGYLRNDLDFIDPSKSKYSETLLDWKILGKYPVAMLGDLEVHFLHYNSPEESRDKWVRRVERINYNNLIYKFCDRDLSTPSLIQKFDSLPFARKICLTAKHYEYESCLKLVGEDGEFIKDEWKSFQNTVAVDRFMGRFLRVQP